MAQILMDLRSTEPVTGLAVDLTGGEVEGGKSHSGKKVCQTKESVTSQGPFCFCS